MIEGVAAMRKLLSILLCLIMVFALSSCSVLSFETAPGTEYGSFTIVKTSSYDGKYYAYMTQHDEMIVVNIYSEDDEEVFTFEPCRKSDFWGVCWENDSYNLWVQSGDLGVLCYTMSAEVWTLDDSAVRPDYILSKYDDMGT